MKRTNFGDALKRVAIAGMALGLMVGGFAAMVTGVSVVVGAFYGAAAWGGLLTVSAVAVKSTQMAGLSQGSRRFSERHAAPSANGLPFETLKRMHEQTSLRAQFVPAYAVSATQAKVNVRPSAWTKEMLAKEKF